MDNLALDLDSLMTQTTQAAHSTRRPALPEDDYTAIIKSLGDRDGNLRPVKTKYGLRYILPVTYSLTNITPELAKAVAQEEGQDINVRQDIWLDMTEAGSIDEAEGKNTDLGRLRMALGQNEPGMEWSLAMLKGAGPILIKVTLRTDVDTGDQYNDVKKVTAIA